MCSENVMWTKKTTSLRIAIQLRNYKKKLTIDCMIAGIKITSFEQGFWISHKKMHNNIVEIVLKT